jgi:Ca-activated chloride channel homolog
MTENRLPVDDPRLTAYALGELDRAEAAEVERLLDGSPECRATVNEIRELAGLLSTSLEAEPAPALSDGQRMAIVEAASKEHRLVANSGVSASEPAKRQATTTSGRWMRRFASVATIAAMLLAALLVVPSRNPKESVKLTMTDNIPSSTFGTDEQREATIDRLRHEVKNAIFRAERIAEKNPDGAFSLIDKAQLRVEKAGLDDVSQQQLLGSLTRTRGIIDAASRSSEWGINESHRKAEIESGIRNENAFKVRILQPEEIVQQLEEVDEAAPTYTADINYGDVKKWKDLTERRKRFKRTSPPSMVEIMPSDGSVTGSASEEHGEGKPARRLDARAEQSLARRSPAKRANGPSLRRAEYNVPKAPVAAADHFFSDYFSTDVHAEPEDVPVESAKPSRNWGFFSRRNGQPKVLVDGSRFISPRIIIGEEESLVVEELPYLLVRPPNNAEAYAPITENPFVTPLAEPLSTFGVDVDTASYANVRRFLVNRQMPPRNAVRIEEFLNYFRYDYPQPVDGRPFSVNIEVGNAPWQPKHRLVRIGLKGREIARVKRPTSNLVFLVDVSGSMSNENKLPLVKAGLSLLTEQMTEADRVAIVTYSDTAAVRLESTTGDRRQPILDTIASLQAAGSTNGAGGIQLAYETAVRHFVEGGTNRVILCTDGDFNVGVSDDDQLVTLIQERARTKVFFSVFGFGMDNLKDGRLEKLADKGNGHYAYIDSQREAKKVFVDELAGTLVTIAKDVKLQVEFNPSRVGAYRLIGYENRALAAQDFHDDRKDAGEIGAGHSVTALYEIVPVDNESPKPAGEGLRYQRVGVPAEGALDSELLTVKLRYKQPEADQSELFEIPAADPSRSPGGVKSLHPSRDFQWAAAVAAFGMVLRDSQFRGQAGLDMVIEMAQGAKGEDHGGLRQEFIELVQTAKSISQE